MRRVVHLLIVIVIVVGVRACGADAAEDRLASGTRWVGEKTGLTTAVRWWQEGVHPRIAQATGAMSQRAYYGLARGLDALEQVVVGIPRWIWDGAVRVTAAAGAAVRDALMPARQPAEPPAPPEPTTS